MQIMSLHEITELLETLKEQHDPDSRITCLSLYEEQQNWYGADYSKKYRALEHETRTEALYMVKYPIHTGNRLLSVASELICTRIGRRLFTLPLCPAFAIADPLSDKHDKGFGSKFLAGYDCVNLVNSTDLTNAKNINSSILARIIVFHIWLVAHDAEILIQEDGNEAFSIDHGFFLHWNIHNTPYEVYAELLAALDAEDIEIALNELESIDQRRVVEQFAFIPAEWLSNDIRGVAFLAEKIVQRRGEVRTKISSMRAV
jgi:hypothetical protein